MRHLRTLGLAMVAAIALLGLGGGAPAQASTSLYTDSAKTIRYPEGTAIDLSLKAGTSTELKKTNGEKIATCTESTAKGKTAAAETGEAISISLETLSWGGCSQTTDTIAKGKLEIKWTSGTSGEVIGKSSEWTLAVFGASCSYGFGEGTKLGTIAGGSEPELSISVALPRTAGNTILCPSTATFNAKYLFTEAHAIFVGSTLATSLYTDSAKTIRYPEGTAIDLSLKAGTSTELKKTNGEMIATCTGSTAKGKTANETGEAISISLETLSWSGCNHTTDTVANGKLEIKWSSGTSGEVIGKSSEWTVGVFGVSCNYGFGEGTKLGTITGGSEPELSISVALPRTAGSTLFCPSSGIFEAKYLFTEPHAVFVGS